MSSNYEVEMLTRNRGVGPGDCSIRNNQKRRIRGCGNQKDEEREKGRRF